MKSTIPSMYSRAIRIAIGMAVALAVYWGGSAHAQFRFMQIDRVIGGVNGDTSAQAIQLRMRSANQHFVSFTRLVVVDAAGQNPITVKDMTSDVGNGLAGARVLIVSSNFSQYMSQQVSPDFIMTQTIPTNYLAAGRLIYQDDFGTIYWSLSWGGSSYTGPQTGSLDNDANGNFGPACNVPLPSATLQALRFNGTASALSTDNLADYSLTAGVTTFVNNAGESFVVTLPPPLQAVDWFTVNGGGGTSTNGTLALRGTIGQLDAGRLTNGTTVLNGGFWGGLVAVQTPGAPLLSITMTNSNTVMVSWPAPSPGFNLQQNTDLSTTNWVTPAEMINDDGMNKFVLVNPPTGNRFYRLFRP